MIPLTEVLQREYDVATKYHISMKQFDDPEKNWKVSDRCYYTGLHRGAAQSNCNYKYKIPNHILIVFHDLSSYNAHLFIYELGKKFNTKDIDCIVKNKRKVN